MADHKLRSGCQRDVRKMDAVDTHPARKCGRNIRQKYVFVRDCSNRWLWACLLEQNLTNNFRQNFTASRKGALDLESQLLINF